MSKSETSEKREYRKIEYREIEYRKAIECVCVSIVVAQDLR